MNDRTDYYKVLNVRPTASSAEIKKAYRTKSLETHPDKTRGEHEDTTKEFQEISEAYDILSDEKKRKNYDHTFGFGFGVGGEFMENNEDLPTDIFNFLRKNLNGVVGLDFPNHFNGVGNANFFHVDDNTSHINFHEVMQRPTPIVKKMEISLQQAFTGCTMPLKIERWICQGSIKKTEIETIYFSVPEGVDDNEIIIMREKGNVLSDNRKGDIKIFITVSNNTHFKRSGLDLIYKKTITLKEALCGFSFCIKYLDERTFKIENRNGIIVSPDYNKIIPGLGMVREKNNNDEPKCLRKGNLVIIFTVSFPEKLTKEQIDKIDDCFPE